MSKIRKEKLRERINAARLLKEDFNEFYDDNLFIVAGDEINGLRSQLTEANAENERLQSNI